MLVVIHQMLVGEGVAALRIHLIPGFLLRLLPIGQLISVLEERVRFPVVAFT